MMDVIAHAEPLGDELLDALRGPQLRAIALPLRATCEQLDQGTLLGDRQLRRPARTRLALQGPLTFLAGLLQPLTDRGPTDSQSARDVRLAHAFAIQGEGLKTSVFQGGRVSYLSHAERLTRATEDVK